MLEDALYFFFLISSLYFSDVCLLRTPGHGGCCNEILALSFNNFLRLKIYVYITLSKTQFLEVLGCRRGDYYH